MNNIMKHTALQFPPFKGGLGKVLFLLLLLFPLLMQAQESETTYLEQIRVDGYTLQKLDNGKVQLDMTIRFDNLQLNRQHALRIVPMLLSADEAYAAPLDAIQLYGTQRYKALQRARLLNNTPAASSGDRLHPYKKGATAPLNYTVQLPFQPWMVESHLHLVAHVEGCARCDEGTEYLGLSQALLSPAMLTPQQNKSYLAAIGWQPLYAEALPLPVEEKLFDQRFRAYIQFPQGSHAIRPQLGKNVEQLDAVFASLKLLNEDDRLLLTGINVQGYASPEGGAALNQRLSERRARSFVDYIAGRNKQIDRSLFRAEGRGEAWSQLQTMLQEEPLAQTEELVQQAIDNPSQQDAIDRQLRNLPVGRTLMADYYPRLRHIAYSASYRVRPIGVEEGRSLINTRPDLLSSNEVQQVADSYLPDLQQYIAALQKARQASNHKTNSALAYNLALAQHKAGLSDEALQTLLDTVPTAPVCNLRGVLLYQADRYDEAIQAFRQAANLGSEEAKNNLSVLVR